MDMVKSIKSDLKKAISILEDEGCKEVYVFGSMAEDRYHEDSDIDLAVSGIPQGEFFRVLGRLLFELDHTVDLIDLDRDDDFSKFLKKEGELVRAS